MPDGKVIPLHEPWRYSWFGASAPDHLGTTSSFIAVCIPFPHILRRAYFGYESVNEAGSIALALHRGIDGLAEGAIGAALGLNTDGNAAVQEISLLSAEDSEVSAENGAVYFVEITASNAADDIDRPTLQLGVSTIPPGPA